MLSVSEKAIDTLPLGGKETFILRILREQPALAYLLTFLLVLAVLKVNQYLFFTFHTSPAVVLLPTGIGLAVVYLAGYRMALPLSLAWLASLLTSPAHPPLLLTLSTSLVYPLQAVIGAYALKKLRFDGVMGHTRDALILVMTALLVPVIAPAITTSVQWLAGTLTTSAWLSFSRAWAGGIMSILVFTPLIITWALPPRPRAVSLHERIEHIFGLGALAIGVYIIFWTTLGHDYSFFALYVLFGILFWIGLRMQPRIMTAAVFLITELGIAGIIIAHPNTATALNQQLLSAELFVVFIAPIFYILTALVEERRANAAEAHAHTLELQEANRRLSLEDRSKTEFIAILAHELRNPLAPIVSSLELVRLKAEKIRQRDMVELVDIADTHARTMAHLLDDLLDVSRISRKKFKLDKATVSLQPIIDQAVGTVSTTYAQKNHLFLVAHLNEDLLVNADSVRLEQIIVNLLSNAAKYTEPRGRIELGVLQDERDVRINITDNGKGIEQRMLRRIFEPFMQAHPGAGLGIGLSLTKRLVELHGGRIWAESGGVGKGSTFVLLLPRGSAIPLPLAAPAHSRAKDKGPTLARTFSILVVDDNKAAADGLARLLTHYGHTVSTAYDGSGALEEVQSKEPEVALLDIGLPDMDGYTVARQLRQTYSTNPLLLIALTGYGQESDKLEARDAGFDYHLTKPIGVSDIENVLAHVPA
jgi:signal transduction histidine kinase